MKLVSLVALAAVVASGFASASSNPGPPVWTITSANATKPEQVLGKHQEFVKVWTITGAKSVDSIHFSTAGLVFIDYDANLNSAATPAPTAKPATIAPTTDGPTELPTTESPITEAPTTKSPTTESPTTEAPTTEAPTTASPTTASPTTEAPTTEASTTEAPSSGSAAVAPIDGVVSFTVEDAKVVAKVVLSGNCTKLLDEFEVVERDGAISVRFKNEDFRGFGYILTQVVMGEKAMLAKISSSGSSSVYVGEGVFATANKRASISISGDADVYVTAPNTDFSLDSFDFKVSGSGNVQFHAAGLTLSDTLSSKISGDATIAVVAKSIAVNNTIESKISGEGNVYVQAGSVTAFKIDTKISGEGDITISSNGSCVSQAISISGEGHVATGSILCEDTSLRMSGQGSVLVQTSGTFKVPREIDGKVQYVGAPPQTITDGHPPKSAHPHPSPPRKHHGWHWGWWDEDSDDDSEEDDRHLPNSVTIAPENTYTTYELREVPAREPTFLVLTMNHNRWGSDPNKHTVISILGWDIDIGGDSVIAGTQEFAARVHEQHGPLGSAALGVFVVAAIAAVGVAVHKVVLQRRRRREYQPLLQVVTK